MKLYQTHFQGPAPRPLPDPDTAAQAEPPRPRSSSDGLVSDEDLASERRKWACSPEETGPVAPSATITGDTIDIYVPDINWNSSHHWYLFRSSGTMTANSWTLTLHEGDIYDMSLSVVNDGTYNDLSLI
jgi:hypothetical protein